MPTLLNDSLFWLILALLGFVFSCGLGLLVVPNAMFRLSNYLDRWHSLRGWLGPMDRPHYTEAYLYSHHRLIGLLLTLGSAYTLLRLSSFDPLAASSLFPNTWPRPLLEIILGSLPALLLITNLIALVLGVLIYFRPSLLRHFEEGANHWYSARQALRPLDIPRPELDNYLWRHPRTVGLFLVLGSIYIAAMSILHLHKPI